MSKFFGGRFGKVALGLAGCLSLVMVLAVCGTAPTPAAEEAAAGPEPAPPEGQTYTGSKRCASCHFEQFMAWKKTGHSKAFETLTAKYQKDPKCLKCHTTGFGEPTGFKDNTSTGALAGITCETCHGPGSKHEASRPAVCSGEEPDARADQDDQRFHLEDSPQEHLCGMPQGARTRKIGDSAGTSEEKRLTAAAKVIR